MNVVRLTTECGLSWTTNVAGNEEEARRYFVGKEVNIGPRDGQDDFLVRVVGLEFINGPAVPAEVNGRKLYECVFKIGDDTRTWQTWHKSMLGAITHYGPAIRREYGQDPDSVLIRLADTN